MLNLKILKNNSYIKQEIKESFSINKNNIIYTDLILFLSSTYIVFIIFLSKLIELAEDYYFYKFKSNPISLSNKSTLIIYRIENNEGVGPYRCTKSILNSNNTPEKPTPFNDIKNIWTILLFTNEYKRYKFGFKDLEQLNSWFTQEEQNLLFKNGFEIKTYETENYHISDKQVIFKQ